MSHPHRLRLTQTHGQIRIRFPFSCERLHPERGKITIVDFYADWCGPSRKIGPVLQKIAAGNSDIVLQKINVDKHRDLMQEYTVTGIPHIIIYDKSADVVDTIIGADEHRVRKAIADAGGGS